VKYQGIVLLTAAQVAKLLSLKPSTVYDAALRGRLPCVRLWEGHRRAVVRFDLEEIEKLIRGRSVPAKVTR
jgi:excisionase family DNA binding protein